MQALAGLLGVDGLGLDGGEAMVPQPTNRDSPRLDEIGIFASPYSSKVLGQSEERIVDAICHEGDVRL